MEQAFQQLNQDLRKTSLSKMSEKVFTKLLNAHREKPSFVFELFELAEKIDSDEKRNDLIIFMKNLTKSAC